MGSKKSKVIPMDLLPNPTNIADVPWTPCSMNTAGFLDPTFGIRKTFKMYPSLVLTLYSMNGKPVFLMIFGCKVIMISDKNWN